MNYKIKQANIKTNNRRLSWTDIIFVHIILAIIKNLQNMFVRLLMYINVLVFIFFLIADLYVCPEFLWG